MGLAYSLAHAACLAAQLPRGSRCFVADDPHDEWDESTWMLWHIYRRLNQLRWGFVKLEGEDQPEPLPYPGQAQDAAASRKRFEANKSAVDAAFNMNGGDDVN